MEVHHHPHPGKKKFKEYFLEFLMIFLAVTLGFFAENIREHISENKQGGVYIKSLAEDLEKDTTQYTSLIRRLAIEDSITDNIFNCYDTIMRNAKSTACLAHLVHNLLGFTDFVYTDRTMQQLKGTGGLRLIKGKGVADSIIAYDAAVRSELIHQEGLEVYQQKSIDANKAMLNFKSFTGIYSYYEKPVNIELLQNDKQAVNNYFNTLFVFKRNLSGQKANLQTLKQKAEHLLRFLNEKS
jgi:hypothetical protein